MANTSGTIELDLSQFTFTAEQIRDINELVYEGIMRLPEISAIHQMWGGIIYDKEVGFIMEGGLVGKAGQGCDPEPQDWSIPTRKVVWEPKEWEIFLKECAEDLKNTAAIYSMRTGTEIDNLTDTDFMNIVVEVLIGAVYKMLYRIIWLNDVNAEEASDGGTYTDGLDLDYFNIIDGLFNQLRVLVTADSKRGVSIAANAQATYAAQMSGMTPQDAYDLLSTMWYQAPIKLRAMKADINADNRPKFLVTQSIADAYEQYLIGMNLPQTFINLTEGVQVLSFLGVPVVPMPIWDEMIQAFQDLGSSWYNPHRALLTSKSVLAVGSPTRGKLFGEFDIWYDKTKRGNYILLKDKIDAKIANPDHFIYAE